MATVTVIRDLGRDPFGDPLGVAEHAEDGCKVAWGSVSQITTANGHMVELTERRVTLLFRRRQPNILDTDRIRLPDGREFTVEGVNPWEHARHEGLIVGTEVILSGVR